MTKHIAKEDRRQQILEAAARCFARKGYYEANIDDIIEEANLSKGALYWYFKSKQELFRSLWELWYRKSGELLEEALAAESSFAGQFRALFRVLEARATELEAETPARIEFLTMALRDDALLNWKREQHGLSIKMMSKLLKKGIESGEFRRVNVDATAKLVWASVDGALVHRQVLKGQSNAPLSFSALGETLLAMLLAEDAGVKGKKADGVRKGGGARATGK